MFVAKLQLVDDKFAEPFPNEPVRESSAQCLGGGAPCYTN